MPNKKNRLFEGWEVRKLTMAASRSLLVSAVFLLSFLSSAWGQSSLWVSHFQGKTLYLMGSIHVLQESHYPLPEVMEEAFKKSDLVVFEIDQEEMESAESQQLVRKKGFYKGEDTLERHISPATFQALKVHLNNLQLPISLFQRMTPANCALVLTMMEFQRLGYEARFGLDHYFSSKASRKGKKKGALETAEFQINLFFDLTAEDQDMFLNQTLLELNSFAREAGQMDKAWQKGDSEQLHKLLSASFEQFPDLYQNLIVKRNRNWLPQIENFLQQNQTVLVIVGAGHLVGPQSLLRMLGEKGYSFSQL
ncbi:MAG: TraB/GumN family protein [Thermodesulfobacteriota bacterium]